jgi:transcriptional regulator with XRE-family HTH domain
VEGELQLTVGRNLRAYRQTQGLSQEAFADVVGVHRTYLGGIERGEHNLTLRSVERIAGRIGLDPMVLFEVREPPPGLETRPTVEPPLASR